MSSAAHVAAQAPAWETSEHEPSEAQPTQGDNVQPLSHAIGFAIFVLISAGYASVGYFVTIQTHVIQFEVLDRLNRALMIWHNSPPKLAAIGFDYAPLKTFMFLPTAVVKPLASSLISIPITSACFAAITVITIERILARCAMPAWQRVPIVVLFGVNPLWLFYASNGSGESVGAALLALALYCLVRWYDSGEPRYVIGCGFAVGLGSLASYQMIVWGITIAAAIIIVLSRQQHDEDEVEGSFITFIAPLGYGVALWTLFNWLIAAKPFGWFNPASPANTLNATKSVSANFSIQEVFMRVGELSFFITLPLAVALCSLVAVAVTKRDARSSTFVLAILTAILTIAVIALISQREIALSLRMSLPLLVSAVFAFSWVYRRLEGSTAIWAAACVSLILGGLITWKAMQTYPFQTQEQAFARALATGETQEGRASEGGFRVGIGPEVKMASYIKKTIHNRDAILTDNSHTFAVMLLTGRPQLFIDRIDRGDKKWDRIARKPQGKARYFLVNTQPQTPDLLRGIYPGIGTKTIDGFSVVAQTQRYALLQVTAKRQRARR